MTTTDTAHAITTATPIDTGPLSWVMEEIREALARSRTALQEAGGRAAEDQATQLQHAKTHLHQAHGALQMVDVEGVGQVTALAETALDRFKSGAVKCTTDHVEAVTQLYQALVEYLEELLAGAPSQPARLYPYYRAVQEIVGAERIHPADLFFPDLARAVELPAAADAVPDTAPDYAARRQRFERALLPYLKSADPAQQREHAAALTDAVAAVAAVQQEAKPRAFWLALQAFAELVAGGDIAGSVQVKQLFGMINLQLRRLSQGNAAQPDAMLRDALFFIAVAGPDSGSPTARALHAAFALDGLAPPDYDTRRYGQRDALAPAQARSWQDAAPERSTAEIKAALRAVEHALDRFYADPQQRAALTGLAPALDGLQATLTELEQPAAAQAALQVQSQVAALAQDGADPAQEAKTLDDVVHNLSALGFFAELLAHNAAGARQRFAYDARQGSFRAVPFSKMAGAESIPVLDDAVPPPPPAAPPPETVPAVETAANAPHLLELFLSEARETLDFADTTLAVDGPGNEQYLIMLRRSFNTLKGSARTVALDDFADGAHAIERVMNTWLAEERPVDAALTALLERAARELRAWTDLLASDGAQAPLTTRAQALAADARRVIDGVADAAETADTADASGASDALASADNLPAGDAAIPAPLLAIFLAEAGQLVDQLAHDFGAWRQIPQRAAEPQSLRAAHTLAGISGTVGVPVLRALALALEDTLVALQAPAPFLDQAQHDLFDFTAQRLRQMVDTVGRGDMPAAQPELIAALAALRAQLQASAPAANAALDAQLDQLVAGAQAPGAAAHDESPLDAMFRQVYDQLSGTVPASAEPAPAPKKGWRKVEPRVDDDIDDLFNAAFDETFAEPPLHIAAPAAEMTSQPLPAPAESTSEPVPAADPVAVPAPFHADTGITELPLAAPAQRDAPPAIFNDELDAELLAVFLEEGADLLPQVGEALRAWQGAPLDAGHAQGLLRLLHTVKGSARMAGAMRLGQHVHEIETHIENMVHEGSATPLAFDELLAHYDHALLLFEQLQQGGMAAAVEADAAADPGAAPCADAPSAPCADDQPANKSPLVRVRADILDRLVNQAGEVSIARSRLENEVGAMRATLGDVSDNLSRLRRQLREIEMQAESQIASSMSRMADVNERDFDPLEFDRFTRLQELTRMMAESVNDAASLHEHLSHSVNHASDDLVVQARLTRDLQRDLMRVRMVPFASIAERLFRVARQSAKEVDKRVNLDLRGGGVEIDRGVLERMAAPFEHLLRNAIAHGVEPRAARTAAGKSETGELLMEVAQQGNEVVIEFSDDGAGLDLERIRAKGVASGLLAEGEDVTEAQVADLIFEPGFTTAEALTELSGRGVGMDIVQSEAQALGGRVDLESTPGQGTRFVIRLPLTLAVTQVVLVAAGGRSYALPAILVEQVQQMNGEALAAAHQVGHLNGHVALHGRQAALHYLPALLGDIDMQPQVNQSAPVMMLKNGTERLALQVDEVLGNREVVVKNIGPQLARMAGIAGATVLGSGDIVLILNPVALLHHLAQNPEARAQYAQAVHGDTDADAGTATRAHAATVMVVDDSMTVRRVTGRLLEREGYRVLLAKDGVDALEQLREHQPDLLLVDIEMPRMDGFDLTRQVRGDERTAGIPIIMITSRSADKHRNYALDLGVDAFFGKPFQEPELLETMEKLLNPPAV
ncbi:UNVERIFIED_ORG: chemosensory pili system protein ChpA (sensor histidine kinase/response regulator) [Zoogloea ramigera]|uniref:histidine kinase n=1 Tax=Duganella zoogloeoides TaxID=75659 RepID=A0ABZ0XWC0_9BURK|nr:Hpt domain-containing protein [Duganella zoogloeoides]WQH03753.1 Hpt domain-containing protein [Duganella zoogloeoides]